MRTEVSEVESVDGDELSTRKIVRKKRVSFADHFGLELAYVQQREGQAAQDEDTEVWKHFHSSPCSNFCFHFCLTPVSERRRLSPNVWLKNIFFLDMSSILVVVEVHNIAYEKTVFARCTFDSWESFEDIPASYVVDSCDGCKDEFVLSIHVPRCFQSCREIQFAICYRVEGHEFWDNNDQRNYIIKRDTLASSCQGLLSNHK